MKNCDVPRKGNSILIGHGDDDPSVGTAQATSSIEDILLRLAKLEMLQQFANKNVVELQIPENLGKVLP